MKTNLIKLVAVFLILLVSCSKWVAYTERPRNNCKGEYTTEKRSYLSALITGFLEYFGRKQRVEEDKHPAFKGFPPEKKNFQL